MTRALRREDRYPVTLLGDWTDPGEPPPPVVPALPRRRPSGPLRPVSERALAAARALYPRADASGLAPVAAALEEHLGRSAREGAQSWRALVVRLYGALTPCRWSGCQRAATRMAWDDGREEYACDDHAASLGSSLETPRAAVIRDAEQALAREEK